jgi:hypothetical protein
MNVNQTNLKKYLSSGLPSGLSGLRGALVAGGAPIPQPAANPVTKQPELKLRR